MKLETLLSDAHASIDSGSLAKARDTLKSSVGLYPKATQAWMTLADVQEKLGEWDGAYSTWESLGKLAQEPGVRDLAQAALQRVNDERVIGRLVRAEQMAGVEDYVVALNVLLDAASLKPTPRTFERVRNRYFEMLGLWFAKEISFARTAQGWDTVAVANFVGGSQVEGSSIRDRICSSLAGSAVENPRILFLSDSGVEALKRGEFRQVPDRDRKEIEQAGADAIVFGTVGGRLQSYLFETRAQETHPLLTVQPFSAIPGFPTNVEAWTRLPDKSSTSRGLRVEVWTERTSYRIDDEVIFHIRSNRDCHVTLLDLQTSGGLYVLFPSPYHRDNYVRANQVCTIPGHDAPFSINATGPAGIEGVKAIATSGELNIRPFTTGETFVQAKTADLQTRLCRQIRTAVENLDSNEWDIAEWTFEIVERGQVLH